MLSGEGYHEGMSVGKAMAHPSPLWMPRFRVMTSPSRAAATAACSERKLDPLFPARGHNEFEGSELRDAPHNELIGADRWS